MPFQHRPNVPLPAPAALAAVYIAFPTSTATGAIVFDGTFASNAISMFRLVCPVSAINRTSSSLCCSVSANLSVRSVFLVVIDIFLLRKVGTRSYPKTYFSSQMEECNLILFHANSKLLTFTHYSRSAYTRSPHSRDRYPETTEDNKPVTNTITSMEQLDAIYEEPHGRAIWKEIDYLNEDYCAFVKASPFVILASVGSEATDCSPRGDPAGFVSILDSRTLALPDRPGNNRIDTLRNLVTDPRISLLFLIRESARRCA